jgi:hypothetical protein
VRSIRRPSMRYTSPPRTRRPRAKVANVTDHFPRFRQPGQLGIHLGAIIEGSQTWWWSGIPNARDCRGISHRGKEVVRMYPSNHLPRQEVLLFPLDPAAPSRGNSTLPSDDSRSARLMMAWWPGTEISNRLDACISESLQPVPNLDPTSRVLSQSPVRSVSSSASSPPSTSYKSSSRLRIRL